ncbi:transcription elongation factor GreA [Candidatus Symbiothrix dinenymphae]|nr:transcription elongation factor GreA [Candidatus Symbiothrix dinenymphae]
MSIFSKIVKGEVPSYKIVEDKFFYAFLDIHPVAKGHVLVVPKKEVDYIFDMDDKLLAEMFVFAKKVAKAMKKVLPCKKIALSVIGLEVPHVHIHLIPINDEGDLDFKAPRKPFTPQELESIAAAIADNY